MQEADRATHGWALPERAPIPAQIWHIDGMKSLEFQAVAVIGVRTAAPAPNALTEAAGDPVAHAQNLQCERCLLVVALT